MKISIYNPRENAYDEIRILHTEAHPKAMDETRRRFRTVISEDQSHIDIDKNHRFPLPKEVRENISRKTELILFLANQSNGRMVVTEWGIKQ
jgi:DNA-binding transcriptional regulator/RsmH inhibitor MraZ